MEIVFRKVLYRKLLQIFYPLTHLIIVNNVVSQNFSSVLINSELNGL